MAVKQKTTHLYVAVILISALIIAGCSSTTPTPQPPTADGEQITEETASTGDGEVQEPTESEENPPTEAPAATEETSEAEEATALPPDPIPQTIQASDGVALSGMFYPAARAGAPLVVLMHWAPGDQTDWRVIAAWLQNRDLAVEPGSQPWLDASWFPPIQATSSFNIFTFTFRGCEGGCQAFDREGWVLDVEAAMTHAASLPEIDPTQVMTIGASIGADGAAYGCHYYNETVQEGCQIAISLSPGGYLKMPYPEEVAALESESPAKPSRCLYAVGDAEAAGACQNASGQSYLGFEYEGSEHGMALIEPTRVPNPLDIILESITKLTAPTP